MALLIVGLCFTNVVLVKQNRALKAAIVRVGAEPEFLKEGEDAPPLVAYTVSGNQITVNYSDSVKTVLIGFSPSCSACEEVVPYWREIEAACARTHYQIYGVSLGDGPSTSTYLRSHEISVGAFVGLSSETRAQYKLSSTPLTLVIDNRGKVEKIWSGVFTPKSKAEMEKYFGIAIATDAKEPK